MNNISVHLNREDVLLNAPLLFVACSRVKELRGLRMTPLAFDVMNHVRKTPSFQLRIQEELAVTANALMTLEEFKSLITEQDYA